MEFKFPTKNNTLNRENSCTRTSLVGASADCWEAAEHELHDLMKAMRLVE